MSDPERIKQCILPHLDAGYNLARWLTRDSHDAQDVVQEACMRALLYGGKLRSGAGRAWFLTVIRHACYDWCRRNRPAELVDADPEHIEALADPAALDPEQAAERKDESRRLSAALARLPFVFREVLILREVEDLSYKEISSIVGAPLGTVMSRLARARELLRHAPARNRAAASAKEPA